MCCEDRKRVELAQDRDQWWVLLLAILSLWDQFPEGNYLCS